MKFCSLPTRSYVHSLILLSHTLACFDISSISISSWWSILSTSIGLVIINTLFSGNIRQEQTQICFITPREIEMSMHNKIVLIFIIKSIHLSHMTYTGDWLAIDWIWNWFSEPLTSQDYKYKNEHKKYVLDRNFWNTAI